MSSGSFIPVMKKNCTEELIGGLIGGLLIDQSIDESS